MNDHLCPTTRKPCPYLEDLDRLYSAPPDPSFDLSNERPDEPTSPIYDAAKLSLLRAEVYVRAGALGCGGSVDGSECPTRQAMDTSRVRKVWSRLSEI